MLHLIRLWNIDCALMHRLLFCLLMAGKDHGVGGEEGRRGWGGRDGGRIGEERADGTI